MLLCLALAVIGVVRTVTSHGTRSIGIGLPVLGLALSLGAVMILGGLAELVASNANSSSTSPHQLAGRG